MLFNCLWHQQRKLWKMRNKERKDRKNIKKNLKNLLISRHRRCKKLRKRIEIIKMLRRTEIDNILRNKTKDSITLSWALAMNFKLKNKMMMKNRRNPSTQNTILQKNIMRTPLKMYFLKITNLKRMSQNSQRRPIFIRITKKSSQIRTILNKNFKSIRANSTSKMPQRRNPRKNQKHMKLKRFASLLVILKSRKITQRQQLIKKND